MTARRRREPIGRLRTSMRDRWKEISSLFNRALECPEARRSAFLAHACGADDALRQEVASLLENHEAASRFLNGGAAEMIDVLIRDAASRNDDHDG